MRKEQVDVGGVYEVRVSGNLVPVRIRGKHYISGWDAENVLTGRDVRIRTAARLRRPMSGTEVQDTLTRRQGRP